MKIVIINIALMSVIAFSAVAQPMAATNAESSVTKPQDPQEGGSELEFIGGNNHNFGKIPQGTPITFEFKFRNTGTQPIILATVKPTCGCTIANYTKDPVMPGKEGSIPITYNAAAPGLFNKTITVIYKYDKGDNSNISFKKTLAIRGEVQIPESSSSSSTISTPPDKKDRKK